MLLVSRRAHCSYGLACVLLAAPITHNIMLVACRPKQAHVDKSSLCCLCFTVQAVAAGHVIPCNVHKPVWDHCCVCMGCHHRSVGLLYNKTKSLWVKKLIRYLVACVTTHMWSLVVQLCLITTRNADHSCVLQMVQACGACIHTAHTDHRAVSYTPQPFDTLKILQQQPPSADLLCWYLH